jgi:hypothetical protein
MISRLLFVLDVNIVCNSAVTHECAIAQLWYMSSVLDFGVKISNFPKVSEIALQFGVCLAASYLASAMLG